MKIWRRLKWFAPNRNKYPYLERSVWLFQRPIFHTREVRSGVRIESERSEPPQKSGSDSKPS